MEQGVHPLGPAQRSNPLAQRSICHKHLKCSKSRHIASAVPVERIAPSPFLTLWPAPTCSAPRAHCDAVSACIRAEPAVGTHPGWASGGRHIRRPMPGLTARAAAAEPIEALHDTLQPLVQAATSHDDPTFAASSSVGPQAHPRPHIHPESTPPRPDPSTVLLPDPEPEQPTEAGILPEQAEGLTASEHPTAGRSGLGKGTVKSKPSKAATTEKRAFSYPPAERSQIRESWGTLMRWSKYFKTRKDQVSPLQATRKIVVFGGGSFGTAVGCVLAKQKADMDVVLLLRDPHLCKDINQQHCNTRYLKEFPLPPNVRATTNAAEAILGAQFAVHAVPVQSSRAFLVAIRDLLPPTVPIICLSKGLEVGTGLMMSELIPSALERKQPAVFLSGPSFAREVMENRPTGVVAACKDAKLNRVVQALFANQTMRVNTTSDVIGVEICGALKNVLAIAAGIVEGLDLGHNALAALIAQGCSEIRWLSEKMGGKPTTMSGLSGLGDIMLTCYGSLSRNRSVGIRLGKGERLEDILASSPQVAEGVATAGVVVSLARKYRVSLPVLTAVAQVLDNALTPSEAVSSIMNLPQIEER